MLDWAVRHTNLVRDASLGAHKSFIAYLILQGPISIQSILVIICLILRC